LLVAKRRSGAGRELGREGGREEGKVRRGWRRMLVLFFWIGNEFSPVSPPKAEEGGAAVAVVAAVAGMV